MNFDRRLYWIWLQRRLPLGSTVINLLFEHFEDITDIYAADKKQLERLGLRSKIVQALMDKSLRDATRIVEDMGRVGGWVLTPDDARYPDSLRHIAGFPAVLYVQGVLPDFNTLPAVAVVSTRNISDNGAKFTFCLSAGLAAAGAIVVSGGAKNGDAAAHEGALYAGGKTVLVKAASPEVEYPPENTALRREILKSGGAIVTEYPPFAKEKCDYHVRNRLIAGMSVGACITEAPARSGTLITANFAREQGKEVFAVPGGVFDGKHDGAHQQIRQGAMLITCAVDILEEYAGRYAGILDMEAARSTEETCKKAAFGHAEEAHSTKKTNEKTTETVTVECPPEASSEAKRVFALMEAQPCLVDVLAKKAELPPHRLLILLTELEMLQCVEQTAGQQYRKKIKR